MKINKEIVVVTKNIEDVESILFNMQSTLTVAAKRNCVNAPGLEDTKIKVVFINRGGADEVNEIKRDFSLLYGLYDGNEDEVNEIEFQLKQIVFKVKTWHEMFANASDVSIVFDYVIVPFYTEKTDLVKIIKEDDIENIAVLVDVMYDSADHSLDIRGAEYLCSELGECALSYMRYDNYGTMLDAINSKKDLFRREHVMGTNIYKPLQDRIYNLLNIGK